MGALVGYACAGVSVLFFGSNFVVVHKYDAGDGMFFQLALCLGIWCTGLVVFLVRGAPPFYPLALCGGAVWCTGNCCTVFIIKKIGLGPGLVTWGTMALVIGWLSGFFGLFGLPNEQRCLQMPWLNVVGFGLSLVALVDSTFIKKGVAPRQDGLLIEDSAAPVARGSAPEGGDVESGRAPRKAAGAHRVLGMLAAIWAGCCYGVNFHPSTWIMNHVDGASQNGLDYVFNQFCGILLASICYFVAYSVYMQNKPVVNPEIVLPGMLSGIMWGIAQTCWFVANAQLGYSAAFPIILIGPGFVGSMWSVLLFKDIHGRRNYCLLAAYFVIAAAACGCIVLSRKDVCT